MCLFWYFNNKLFSLGDVRRKGSWNINCWTNVTPSGELCLKKVYVNSLNYLLSLKFLYSGDSVKYGGGMGWLWNCRLLQRKSPSNCSTSWTRCRASWMKPTALSTTSTPQRRSYPSRTPTCWGSWRRRSPRCRSSASWRYLWPPNLRTPSAWPMRSPGWVSSSLKKNDLCWRNELGFYDASADSFTVRGGFERFV